MKESQQRVRHQAEEIARQISRQIPSDPSRDPLQAAVQLCGSDELLLMKVIGLLDERLVDTSQEEDLQVRDPFVNQKIGGFKIRWKLDTGGNGDVYIATRIKEPHQQVAIKFLRLRQGKAINFVGDFSENGRSSLCSTILKSSSSSTRTHQGRNPLFRHGVCAGQRSR